LRTSTLRTAALAVVLPLALTALAGCGSRGAAPEATTGPQSKATHSAPPAAPRHVAGAAFLATLRHASQQVTTARFTMTMDVSGQQVPIKGVIDLTGDSPAMQMTMDVTGMGTPTDLRLVDRVMYVGVPGTSGKFYRVDLGDPNGPLGSLGGGSLANLDPGSMMSRIKPAAFKTVLDRGVTTVHGQRVHHYSAVIDVSAQKKMLDLPATTSVRLPRTSRYDVWLDDQGRYVRFQMTLKKSMALGARYSDYGKPAHIEAPPAADVLDLPTSQTVG